MNHDDNFIYFLADKKSKAKVYPPGELEEKITTAKIKKAWQELRKKMLKPDYQNHKFGIYLHLPFCPTKCQFCYCPSKAEKDFSVISQYVDRLIKEIGIFSPLLFNLEVDSIYVGGGTPSYLTEELIKKVFNKLYLSFRYNRKKGQLNFEASPQTLTTEKIKLLNQLGVNRLTIGVQSIYGRVLKNIERQQSFQLLRDLIFTSRQTGIKYINLDYVAGLPGETLQSFVKGFSLILKLRPDVLHLYSFCPTEDTRFIKEGNIYTAKQNRLRGKMLAIGEKMIKKSGYKEIKNDSWGLTENAKNRQESGRKEFPYSILGLGNHARSNIFKIMFYHNIDNKYDQSAGYHYQGHYLNDEEEFRHFLMLAFRGGISIPEIKRMFNIDILKLFKEELAYLKQKNKLKFNDDYLELWCDNTNEYHFLLKKLFYSPEVMKCLREYYSQSYNPMIDYKIKYNQTFDANF